MSVSQFTSSQIAHSQGIRPRVLFLYGPTGVGKSDYALGIAERIPSEIINMDVGQFYDRLTIGTAKPDVHATSVPHHCFGILNKPEHYTVVAYRALCESLIRDIWSRGKLPIVVGGSGFYLKSLFFPPRLEVMNNKEEEEGDIDGGIDTGNNWHLLHTIDPSRAAQIHPEDTYRIQRALSIWLKTGNKPSVLSPVFNPITIGAAHIICLTRPRAELYDRINQRVDNMLLQGWLDEVSTLRDSPWEDFIRRKKIIGYNELCDVLQVNERELGHNMTEIMMTEIMVSAVDIIKQRTRNYAKRQMSFWRSLCLAFSNELSNEQRSRLPVAITLESISLTSSANDVYSDVYSNVYIDHLIGSLNRYG